MTIKGLKSVIARPSARESLAAADAVAKEAGLPPASLSPVAPGEKVRDQSNEQVVQVNIRVRKALGDQLADRARTENTTQKILICRALAVAGFNVHAEDLRATPAPKRRGVASIS